MLIKNGTIVNAHGSVYADIRIVDDRIDTIAPALDPEPEEEVINATGLLVMPGGVDAHTHMDLAAGASRASDDFLTGTIAAACGGTTTIIDHMAFGPQGCSLMDPVRTYHGLADEKAVIDYSFHGVVDRVDDKILAQLPDLIDAGITSLKFYLTYNNRLDDEQVLSLLQHTGELGMLACVHAEDHDTLTALRERFVFEGKTTAAYHALSRPATCEAEAVARVCELAHKAGDAPLYIVHTSSAEALAAALPLSHNVHLETCPQYLILDEALYALPDHEGLKYLMSPPLRNEASRVALWQGLEQGTIEVVGTDHCPFFFTEKLEKGAQDFTACPGGAPGVELRLALMYSEGVVKRGMSPNRIVELCSTAPAKLFGIYPRKGLLAPGSDADIVIFDPEAQMTVTHDLLHENVDYTPYEGIELMGYPTMTISRGKIVMHEGTFVGQAGAGEFLKRSLPCFD